MAARFDEEEKNADCALRISALGLFENGLGVSCGFAQEMSFWDDRNSTIHNASNWPPSHSRGIFKKIYSLLTGRRDFGRFVFPDYGSGLDAGRLGIYSFWGNTRFFVQ